MRRICVYLFVAALCVGGARAQTFTCPAGMEDMLNYFVMAYPNRTTAYMGPGNANPIYTTIVPDLGAGFAASGYFVWTKSAQGYPWDIKSFDQNYIYDRTTELNWNDPTSFKRFDADLPIAHRCVPLASASFSTNATAPPIQVSPAGTAYSFYGSCQSYKTQNLNYALNTVTAPILVNTNGNLGPVQTRYFNYQYGCNSSFSCSDKEVFSLGYQIGLYEWQHYQSKNGQWVLVQTSNIDQFDGGQATPYLPCDSSYQ